ncbi:MAG: BREX protein BrxB domain-containing protein [Polyangiaceae bacterium]
MTFRQTTAVANAVDALRKDLLREEGPQISTVRNYNFAILPYPPDQEFPLRRAIHELSGDLRDAGWTMETVDLHALLLACLRAQGDEVMQAFIAREKSLAGAVDGSRGLRMLKERIVTLVDTPEGLAADVVREVEAILAKSPDAGRTVIFLGRLAALYPFLRTSALLKHIAGRTHNVAVVLLYPGTVEGETGLRFMGQLPPDRDYRPRIYR